MLNGELISSSGKNSMLTYSNLWWRSC